MIIHWRWVSAAFFISLALTLALELGRRRRIAPLTPILYLLPVVPLLLAVGLGTMGVATAVATPNSTSPIITTTVTPPRLLPAPQVSLRESATVSLTPISPPTEPPPTAVRRLRIPALNLNQSIQPIPLENGSWDVAELGNGVGWLETTAVHPGDDQAMVFVGHMTFANDNLLEQGAFADIPTLPYGSAVILETGDGSHTYRIDSVRRVSPDDTDALYQESGDAILLLTCTDWNPQTGIYENRLLVRASREE